MSSMFDDCSSLTSLDVSGFKTDNVTDMSHMFYGCSSLTSLDVSDFKTDYVKDMASMFCGCSSLTSLDLSSFMTDNVTNMYGMFYSCINLSTISVKPDKWNTANVTDSGIFMFEGCINLVGGNGTKYNWNHTNAEYARIDKIGQPGYFTDNKAPTDGVPAVYTDTGQHDKKLTIYSLSGQRLSQPQRGVNIINGRKVVVK